MEYNLGELLDAAADVNFLHPDGDYDAVIKSAKYAASRAGNHMVVVQFKVITGPYRDKPVTIRNNFVLSPDSPRALDMLFQQLGNLGIPQEWFQKRRQLGGKELMEALAPVLVNRVASIKTKQDQYNGRTQVNVSWVNPATEAGKRAASGAPQPPATPGPKPAAPAATETPSPAPSAPETPAEPAPAQEATPAPAEAQEAAQSVAASDTTETLPDGAQHDTTTGQVTTDSGPELPF